MQSTFLLAFSVCLLLGACATYTESRNGRTLRVHILVKPSRPDISTHLVINTDRRTYLLELRANENFYMPSVAWSYPPGRSQPRPRHPAD